MQANSVTSSVIWGKKHAQVSFSDVKSFSNTCVSLVCLLTVSQPTVIRAVKNCAITCRTPVELLASEKSILIGQITTTLLLESQIGTKYS